MVTIGENGQAEFRFFRPLARKVCVAGDFNDWRTDQLKMVRGENGDWVLRVRLPAGAYKFRYIADGLWYTDFAAFGVEPGRFGMDSVLLMPTQTLKMPAAERQTQAAAA